MTRETVVLVSIDTEEDNWYCSRNGVAVSNIRALEPLARFFDRLGVRPTYLVTYQVAIDPCAAETVRNVAAGDGAEIGAHIHPWNTPPLAEPFLPRNSMLKNLPADLQLAKLECLTAAVTRAFDRVPRVFRAGRFGFGRDTIAALLRCGYCVDSSVTPSARRSTRTGSHRTATSDGPPVTVSSSRFPSPTGSATHRSVFGILPVACWKQHPSGGSAWPVLSRALAWRGGSCCPRSWRRPTTC